MNVRAFTVLAAVVAVVGLAITWALYGGGALWPGLVGNFVASLIAFLLALTWDRRQRAQAQSESRDREAKQAEAVLKDEDERRQAEVRRRLNAVRLEITRLKGSVESVFEDHGKFAYFMPDLPTGAWDAGAESLGRLIADFELIADLSTFYDRVRDLQWRLRFKAEAYSKSEFEGKRFDPMVDAIAGEIAADLERLPPRVEEQIRQPDVQPLGVVYNKRGEGTVYLKLTPSGEG